MYYNKNFLAIAIASLLFASCQKNLQNSDEEPAAGTDNITLQEKNGASGVVYTLSDQVAGNKVLAYQRNSKGELSFSASYATGGTGTGAGLGNQGALALSEDNHTLLTVNPGSNSITSFELKGKKMSLINTIGSGGTQPVSITVDKNIVYVLNSGGTGNISGFKMDHKGMLYSIPGSSRPLSSNMSGAAQISFVNNGEVVVVTEKATNKIISYTIDKNGKPGAMHMINSAHPTPFGFAVSKPGIIYVSEANGGMMHTSAVSSYAVSDNGKIELIQGPVFASQTAACWVVVTNDGKRVFATNTGSNTVTSFYANSKGKFAVQEAAIPTGPTPIDAALSNNDRLLFVLNAGNESISSFSVGGKGELNLIQNLGGLPDGATGLAAK